MWSPFGVWPTTRRFLSSPFCGKYVTAVFLNSARTCSNTVSAILLLGSFGPMRPARAFVAKIFPVCFQCEQEKTNWLTPLFMCTFAAISQKMMGPVLKCMTATVYQIVNSSEHLDLGMPVPNLGSSAVTACMAALRLEKQLAISN